LRKKSGPLQNSAFKSVAIGREEKLNLAKDEQKTGDTIFNTIRSKIEVEKISGEKMFDFSGLFIALGPDFGPAKRFVRLFVYSRKTGRRHFFVRPSYTATGVLRLSGQIT
jgi:hypothetical protein